MINHAWTGAVGEASPKPPALEALQAAETDAGFDDKIYFCA
jgi:hypothetical protein